MTTKDERLISSLEYLARLSDTLEGMRRHSRDTEQCLFAVLAAGLIDHIRATLAEVREYVGGPAGVDSEGPPAEAEMAQRAA